MIINCARGGIVNEADLNDALLSGKVAGAALDVFENEKPKTFTEAEKQLYAALHQQPNVLLSPHVAGWTIESKKRLADILLEKIKMSLSGDKVKSET